MLEFTVKFHLEDDMEEMKVQKLSPDDFERVTEGGTRHLFDLDTNIGFFVFLTLGTAMAICLIFPFATRRTRKIRANATGLN